MADQNMNQGAAPNAASQPQGYAPQQQRGGKQNMLLLVILALVVVIVIVVIVVYFVLSAPSATASTSTIASSSSGSTTSQTASQNSTPIEMSSTQAGVLLRAGISQYSGYDLFNPNSPTNISDLETVVPQLAGNATSGWVTYAAGNNATTNASIEYVVITTSNAKEIASLLNNATLAGLPMTLSVASTGTINGFNYTYAQYVNATANFQTISGYKNGHAVGVTVNSYPIFVMNETDLINAVANDTP